MPTNSAYVINIPRQENFQFAGHTAMKNGWMFTLNIHSRVSFGYLFNDNITDDDEILDEMYKNISPQSDKYRHFTFKSYHAKKFVENRIILNGNRALFYEPIEALSGVFYDTISDYALSYMQRHIGEKPMNVELIELAHDYQSIICYLYQGGSIYNTPFWDNAKKLAKQHLLNSERWQTQKKYLNALTRKEISQDPIVCIFGAKVWSSWDKHFGYKQMVTGKDSLEW